MLHGDAISWKSRRQHHVALSTSEAEYVAVSQCGQDVLTLREIVSPFAVPQLDPTAVYADNMACIAMSENPSILATSMFVVDTLYVKWCRLPFFCVCCLLALV